MADRNCIFWVTSLRPFPLNRVGVQGLGSRVRLCCPEWPFSLLGERKMDLTLVSEMGTGFFCLFIYFGVLGPTCRGERPCEVNFVFCSLL